MYVVPWCISNFSAVLIVLSVVTRSAIYQNLNQTFIMSIYKILRNNLLCSYYLCWSARTQFRISESDLCTKLRVIFPKYLAFCCTCCFLASDPVIMFNSGNLSTSFKQSKENGSWSSKNLTSTFIGRWCPGPQGVDQPGQGDVGICEWHRKESSIAFLSLVVSEISSLHVLYKIWFWLVVYRSMALSNFHKLLL